MYYKLNENREIIITSSIPVEDYLYAEEEIVRAFDGKLVFKSQTQTAEYLAEEAAYNERKDALKQIKELKKKLSETDYQAIKYSEGQLTEAEYADMKAQRQEWRNEINKLEMQYNIEKGATK